VADEDEDRGKKRRAGQENASAEQTIKSVMSTYEGRWWMAAVLERSNMYATLYHFDADTHGMAWRDGQADMGRYLLGQIDAYAANDYQRLIRERNARNEHAAEAAQKAREPEQEPEAQSPLEEAADRQMAEFQAAEARRAREQKPEE
jgi:hypothetical protein